MLILGLASSPRHGLEFQASGGPSPLATPLASLRGSRLPPLARDRLPGPGRSANRSRLAVAARPRPAPSQTPRAIAGRAGARVMVRTQPRTVPRPQRCPIAVQSRFGGGLGDPVPRARGAAVSAPMACGGMPAVGGLPERRARSVARAPSGETLSEPGFPRISRGPTRCDDQATRRTERRQGRWQPSLWEGFTRCR
jgi:hypothetical protein